MKKICVVTAARSEYAPMQWLLRELVRNDGLELQLLVTGAHLSASQGMTVRQIECDGFPIAAKVDMNLDVTGASAIAISMARCAKGVAEAFERLRPDMVVVTGDRYELMPICSTALVMRIPIAHISGGDITEGAIDDKVRNAVTMMASLHFPGTEASADNIIRMTGRADNVFIVGEPGLESFRHLSPLSRSELAAEFGLDAGKSWCIATVHPETTASREYNLSLAGNLIAVASGLYGCQTLITGANADLCGDEMNEILKSGVATAPGKMVFCHNLGCSRYLSFMYNAACVLGNSSSGILEAPFYGVPVVNIGKRQKGRYECRNVLTVRNSAEEIKAAVKTALSMPRCPDYYYGDGCTAAKIVKHIETFLE